MQMPRINGSFELKIAVAVLAATLLAGCATTEERAGSLFVAPGGYEFYACLQLAQTAASYKARRAELEQLMAKAESDAGGKLMSAISYRPDHLKMGGELHAIEVTAREKHCNLSGEMAKLAKPAQPVPQRATPARRGQEKPR